MESRQNINCKFITNSIYSSRTYWLSETHNPKVWLVDCGDIDIVLSKLPKDAVIAGVMLTHVHFDHIYGLNKLIEQFPDCKVYTNEFGRKSLTDPKCNFSRYHTDVEDFLFQYPQNTVVVDEGDRIELYEGVSAEVYYTPGHDESCLCYMVEEMLFTGDAYIPGVKTVTTFPHSNKKKAMESMLKINSFPRGLTIYPGHTVSDAQEKII